MAGRQGADSWYACTQTLLHHSGLITVHHDNSTGSPTHFKPPPAAAATSASLPASSRGLTCALRLQANPTSSCISAWRAASAPARPACMLAANLWTHVHPPWCMRAASLAPSTAKPWAQVHLALCSAGCITSSCSRPLTAVVNTRELSERRAASRPPPPDCCWLLPRVQALTGRSGWWASGRRRLWAG